MNITPRTLGTASALLLIWPIIEVISKKCTWTDCLTPVGNYSLYGFLICLLAAVLWSFGKMIKGK